MQECLNHVTSEISCLHYLECMSPATIESIMSTARDLTQYLKENGQTELALQYSLDALYSAIQHVNAQNMGIAVDRSKVICI